MTETEADRLATHSALATLVRRIELKLSFRLTDVRRTDLRMGELLSRMPRKYSTLKQALQGAREQPDEAISTGLFAFLRDVDADLAQLSKLSLEDELIQGVRPVLPSDRDAACLSMLMGWVDGTLCDPIDVAAEFDTTSQHVEEIEAQVRAEVSEKGVVCPKLFHLLDKTVKGAPVHSEWLNRHIHNFRYSKFQWGVRNLIAAADLLGIQTGLNLMEIGRFEYLTLLSDENYPQLVIDRATDLLVVQGRATPSEIAQYITEKIKQPVKPGDVRIVVAEMPGIRWIGHEREAFERKA